MADEKPGPTINFPHVTLPAYGIFVLLVLKLVLEWASPLLGIKPAQAASWDQISRDVRALTESIDELNRLEQSRIERLQLMYPKSEWDKMIDQVNDIHRAHEGARR